MSAKLRNFLHQNIIKFGMPNEISFHRGYDNYAYNSRNIQPDEELGRRGFSMYDPYRSNNQTANV